MLQYIFNLINLTNTNLFTIREKTHIIREREKNQYINTHISTILLSQPLKLDSKWKKM